MSDYMSQPLLRETYKVVGKVVGKSRRENSKQLAKLYANERRQYEESSEEEIAMADIPP